MPRSISLAFVIALACGGDDGRAVGEGTPASDRAEPDVSAREPGDPLLARARAAIRAGRLPADVQAELLASESPAHAHARRVLTRWAALGAERPGARELDASATAAAPGLEPVGEPAAEPVAPVAAPIAAPAAIEESSPAPARSRPTLQTLSLRKRGDGAVLDLVTGAGVLVGVVHQRDQGIVRLVLEGVAASPKVLAARPSTTGARVTDIDAGPKAVRVTLALDEGYAFDGVTKTASGARVRIRRT